MWSHLLEQLGDKVPRFNDYLLSRYREEKIEQIPAYLDRLFKQSMKTLESKFGDAAKIFKYVDYVELTPEERLEYLRKEVKYNRKFDIRVSNVRTIRYDFTFSDEKISMYVDMPLIVNHAITLNGVDYYPLFAIVEVGGMALDKDTVTLRVMRANLRFFLDEDKQRFSIIDTKGRYSTGINVTCQLHLKASSKPPIILYLLAKYGFTKSMEMLGFGGKIVLTDTCDTCDDYVWVKVNDNTYIRIDKDMWGDKKAVRIIISLKVIYKVNRRFDINIIHDSVYYRVVLGKLTFPSAPNNVLREQNASDHLAMNDSLLDEPSLENFRSIGLNVRSIDDLCVEIFNNIDDYLSSSRLNDLYNKKLASLDKLTSNLIEKFNLKLFNQIINAKPGLTIDSVKRLMFSAGQNCRWMIGSQLFRSMPTIINDNALLTITGKKFRTFGNVEMSREAKRSNMPIDHLKSHPSSIIVESIQTVPTSGIANGSINPYLNIGNDGTFIIDEELKKVVEHVFDTTS